MEEIFIILILILLNGVFAMSEIALISAKKSTLQTEADNGNKSAKRVLNLQEEPNVFLSSVQIGITLIGLLTGMFSGNKVTALFTQILIDAGLDKSLASIFAQTIIIIVVTYLSIVLGELVPKQIGMNAAEKVAKAVVAPMRLISKIAKPIVWILSNSTSMIISLLGIKKQESKVTEDEIKSMIREGTDDGEVLPVEQDIVERVFTLGDLTVSSIMTLRQDIVWLEENMNEESVRKCIEQDLFEEYPVVCKDLDHVVGVLSLKDYVVNSGKKDFELKKYIKKPVYFHEGMNVYKVLEEMKSRKVCRALVCNEFGLCVGLITYKDILEALIGKVYDSRNDPDIVARNNGDGWLIDGQCLLYDFLVYFEIEEEMPNYEYTTIAGLILDLIGHIPYVGEQTEWRDFTLEVADMDGPKIDKVIAKRKV